jgi:hypothetical protein
MRKYVPLFEDLEIPAQFTDEENRDIEMENYPDKYVSKLNDLIGGTSRRIYFDEDDSDLHMRKFEGIVEFFVDTMMNYPMARTIAIGNFNNVDLNNKDQVNVAAEKTFQDWIGTELGDRLTSIMFQHTDEDDWTQLDIHMYNTIVEYLKGIMEDAKKNN